MVFAFDKTSVANGNIYITAEYNENIKGIV
jgi:hypothetical protein